MTELKPCPFCGGDVKWENGAIKCWSCGLSFCPIMADYDKTNEQFEKIYEWLKEVYADD